MNVSVAADAFLDHFGTRCKVTARAPGRVNLIGEHTDYNDGYVLPIATEQDTWVAAASRDDGHIRAFSTELNDEQSWPIAGWEPRRLPHWTSYVAGVAKLLADRGLSVSGANLLICSDVPAGGGLSSSAALETATALALTNLADTALQDLDTIDLCRSAEHEFAGVPCGIMDQSASLLARAGCALLLDCRTRVVEHIPCELGEHAFVVIDSGVRHELAAGEYARRQEQCKRAVEHFRARASQVRALRDVTPAMLEQLTGNLDPIAAARARHVVTENERTVVAAAALKAGDLPRFGELMAKSHRSLRDDYEVSCRELDQIVEIVSNVEGVLGIRMTGGGFGGCTVALARVDATPAIEAALARDYEFVHDGRTALLRTRPGRGASVEQVK